MRWRGRRPHPRDVVVALRPLHWAKNAFVLAPVVFSGKLCIASVAGRAAAVAFAFSLAASASYIVNDLHDQKTDRANPRTRFRPIARGAIPQHLALFLALVLTMAALFLASFGEALPFLAAYIVASHMYTFFFKSVPFLDLACLVGLYVLRLLAGAAAALVPASPWLLVCGGSLALALAWGKRVEGQAIYPQAFVRRTLPLVVAATGLAYVAYSFSEAGRTALGPTAPVTPLPVIVALLRYLQRAVHGEGDPMTAFVGDRLLFASVATWGVLVFMAVVLEHCFQMSHFANLSSIWRSAKP